MQKPWLEEKIGTDIDGMTDGLYFYKPIDPGQEFECKFLLYDKDSEMLYYYLNIM